MQMEATIGEPVQKSAIEIKNGLSSAEECD